MNDISELERRILYALERIDTRVEGMGQGGATAPAVGSSIDVDVLRAELEAERTANAQLTERVRAIKERQETTVQTLERKLAQLTEQLAAQEQSIARLRAVNADLTDVTRQLTEAAEAGLFDAEMVDQAMRQELAALRTARAEEMAEVKAIMAELEPLIGEVA